MSTEKRESSHNAATPTAPSWHRVARHPAGIVMFATEAARGAARSSSPVSRHPLRSKHA
jgi:hypothetical protein